MFSRRLKTSLTLLLIVVAVVTGIVGYTALSALLPKHVSIKEINADPEIFNGAYVSLRGYTVKTSVYTFGPKYILKEDESQIALDGKNPPVDIDLDRVVSFIFDGENYTQTRDIIISVVGRIRYVGLVTDAPSHYVDIERMEPETARWDMTIVDSQQITAETDKVIYQLGETMKVKILKKNLDSKPVQKGISNIDIELSDRTGRSFIRRGVFLTWDSREMLDPGEEAEVYDFALEPWHRIYGIKMPLLPGACTVKISMTVFTDISGVDAFLWLRVAINA
jgi:hypothetical protein